MDGSFPVDLILFGMIAAFLVLRLRSILGRRQGFERPAAPLAPRREAMDVRAPTIDGRAEPPAPARVLPDPDGALGRTLIEIQRMDKTFHPAAFLEAAERAFGLIVGAYASGDRAALRLFVSADMVAAFEAAIVAREQAGHAQKTELRSVVGTLEGAGLRGTVAEISVRFVSDQISLTTDSAGAPVAGADAVTEIVDLWTFERDVSSADPVWRLIAARSA